MEKILEKKLANPILLGNPQSIKAKSKKLKLKIPFDKIKIDKSIIDDAETVEISRNILNGVSLIAKQMDITLVAEGVDDISKAEFLCQGERVHQFQGYLFSKPVSAADARRMQKILPQQSTPDNVIQLPVRKKDSV